MRCDECGMTQEHAEARGLTHCAPPFARQRHAFTGLHPADRLEAEQARKGFTADLGPIKHDPTKTETRARVVREAVYALAMDEQTHADEAHYLAGFAKCATTATLEKFGRMLKHIA